MSNTNIKDNISRYLPYFCAEHKRNMIQVEYYVHRYLQMNVIYMEMPYAELAVVLPKISN